MNQKESDHQGIDGERYDTIIQKICLMLGEVAVIRGTQREYSSKPLKHSIVKRILVFKR